MSHNRSTRLQRRITQLELELERIGRFGEDVYEDDTVILFRKRFPNQECTCGASYVDASDGCVCPRRFSRTVTREFTYTALKAAGGWYVSGASSGKARKTWEEFVDFLLQGEITEMWVVSEWTEVDL